MICIVFCPHIPLYSNDSVHTEAEKRMEGGSASQALIPKLHRTPQVITSLSKQPEAFQQTVSVTPQEESSQVAPQGHPPSLPESVGRVSQAQPSAMPNCGVDSTSQSLDVDGSPDCSSALQGSLADRTSKSPTTAEAFDHLPRNSNENEKALTDSAANNAAASNSTMPAHVTKTSDATVSSPGPVNQQPTGQSNLQHDDEELSKESTSLQQGSSDAKPSRSKPTKRKKSSKRGRALKSLNTKQPREEASTSVPDSSRGGEGMALSSSSIDTIVPSSANNQEIETSPYEATCHSKVENTVDMVSNSVAKPVRRLSQWKKQKAQRVTSKEDSTEHKGSGLRKVKDTKSSSAKSPTKRGRSSRRIEMAKGQYKTPSVVLSSSDDGRSLDLEVNKVCLLSQSCSTISLEGGRSKGQCVTSKATGSGKKAGSKDMSMEKMESNTHKVTIRGPLKGKKRRGRNAPLSSQSDSESTPVAMQYDAVEFVVVRSPERYVQAEDMVFLQKEENVTAIQDVMPSVRGSKPHVSRKPHAGYERPDTDSEADWTSSSEEGSETEIAECNKTASVGKKSSDIESKELECPPINAEEQRSDTDATILGDNSTASDAAQFTNKKQRIQEDVRIEKTHPVNNVARRVDVSSYTFDVDTDPESEWTSSGEEEEVTGKRAVGLSSVALPPTDNSSKDTPSHSDQLPGGRARKVSAESSSDECVYTTDGAMSIARSTEHTESSSSNVGSDVDIEAPDCDPGSLQVQVASQTHSCTEMKADASESSVSSNMQASGSATDTLRSVAGLSSQVYAEETQDLDTVPETQLVQDAHGK